MALRNWIGPSGGLWSTAANWSPSGPAASTDDAVLTGPVGGAFQVVNGPGASASLTFVNATTLTGAINTGALAIGTAAAQGALGLSAGAVLTATSATLLYGPLLASGPGTRLVVTGALTLGGTRTATAALGSNLSITGGATVRAGSVMLAPISSGYPDSIYVDATSSLEVGTQGGVAAGTLTVDAGRTLAGAGTLNASAGIVNAGTIVAQGGTLVVINPVSGAGQLQIAAGATLFLAAAAAPTLQPISFIGAGSTLEIGTVTYFNGVSIASALSAQGVISGFVPGDAITYSGPSTITAATFQPGSNNSGTLTLRSGTFTAGTLTLAGSFSGYTFQVTPNGTSGSRITLVPTQAGGGGSPSAGTSTADAYAWTAVAGGAWNSAANWRNTTTGASPAAIAPGTRNAVTLNGATGAAYQTLIGPGNSASLVALGNTALAGAFNTGPLAIGTASVAGAVNLGPGTTLAASGATVVNGALQAAGAGTMLTVAGGLTLGGARTGTLTYAPNILSTAAGAAIQVGSLALVQTTTGGGNTVMVDSSSSLEVGAMGGAALGQLTIDQGRLLSGAGSITAASGIVDSGTILAQGGTLVLRSSVVGAGTMQIGSNATLVLAGTGPPSTTPVSFVGPGGTLGLVATTYVANGTLVTAPSEQGLISGFARGNTINYTGPASVTAARYQAGSDGGGTLELMAGTTIAGHLTLAGSYGDYVFQVAPGAAGSIDITLATPPVPTDPLFDAAYYLATYPDIAASGVDPAQHFLQYGWQEGRNPSALFNIGFYLNQNPDVAAAHVNPLLHFEAYGWQEGRDPSLGFSLAGYLARNPDVASAHVEPLTHYTLYGRAEGRPSVAATPHPTGPQDPLVDAAFVYAQRPDVAAAGLDATAWFNGGGWRQGVNPDAGFDTTYYLTQNPDLQRAGVNPLAHYEAYGWKEGREPSLVFSTAKYLAAYADVRGAAIDPLLHYLSYGRSEGRMAFLTGGSAPADALVDAAYYDRQLGATLLPMGVAAQQQAAASYAAIGWQRGLDPGPWFDTSDYLARNPDVAAAGINPLDHFERYGWQEGRNPSSQFGVRGYLAGNPDVRAAGLNPLLHYVSYGLAEGRPIYPA